MPGFRPGIHEFAAKKLVDPKAIVRGALTTE
jgi:hypothetical protein